MKQDRMIGAAFFPSISLQKWGNMKMASDALMIVERSTLAKDFEN